VISTPELARGLSLSHIPPSDFGITIFSIAKPPLLYSLLAFIINSGLWRITSHFMASPTAPSL
jgi:hypothetical protein